MKEILIKYRKLLQDIDEWFAGCLQEFPSEIACRKGCSECCRGLFDITLLDGFFLKSGFDMLAPKEKGAVLGKASIQLAGIEKLWPDFGKPYILNYRPEEEWEVLMPDADETPCPLLGEEGACLLYDYRPMTCRLHGLPLLDISGVVMHDEWCTRNFTGKSPHDILALQWSFNELIRNEVVVFREFTSELLNHPINELDTFIACVLLADYDEFGWNDWFDRRDLSIFY